MPEQRLAQTRGECRCPEGVCLYRSGNQPGYCRQEATVQKCPTCGAYPYTPRDQRNADRYRDNPPASSPSVVQVGDIDHPTLCFVQQTDPTKSHVMWRCDRTKGHIGPHSWDVR